jgi:hypothetical protein
MSWKKNLQKYADLTDDDLLYDEGKEDVCKLHKIRQDWKRN